MPSWLARFRPLPSRAAESATAPTLTLTPDQMCVMAVTGVTAVQAAATYNEIVPILNALATPVPVGGGIVTADSLNVRAGPGANAAVVGKLARDAVVEVWGRTPAGDWLCVREPCGWVAAQYVGLV